MPRFRPWPPLRMTIRRMWSASASLIESISIRSFNLIQLAAPSTGAALPLAASPFVDANDDANEDANDDANELVTLLIV